MPFLHVRSLPLSGAFEAADAVRAVSAEFAHAAAVGEEHVTVTWQVIPPHHYASSGKTAASHPAPSHPVLVELVAPDFNAPERIERMLSSAAAAVSRQAGVAVDEVFVLFQPARSGHVFDRGEVVRW
jgi:hypothetical protein